MPSSLALRVIMLGKGIFRAGNVLGDHDGDVVGG